MRSDDFRLSMPLPAAFRTPSLPILVTISKISGASLRALFDGDRPEEGE